MIYSTFSGLRFIIFIPPGRRPLWAGLRLGEASLRLRERPENDEEKTDPDNPVNPVQIINIKPLCPRAKRARDQSFNSQFNL